eukprot:Skav215300  [mRNA]  locus=C9332477:2070:2816:- [translate_table: standard]
MSKIDLPEEPEPDLSVDLIRTAQAVTGELLWLSVRTRPDIGYAVSQMGRAVSKNPRWATELGQSVLGFLAATSSVGLTYYPCKSDRGITQLPIQRHERLVEVYSDVSFAPGGGRSNQAVVILYAGQPIQWEATRQPFHTMSTAEAELVGHCEGLQMALSVESLLEVIYGEPGVSFEKWLAGDNTTAIGLMTKPDGPWRTRHLRLRANCLKERLQKDPGDWKVFHQKGSELCADYLTKPIIARSSWSWF